MSILECPAKFSLTWFLYQVRVFCTLTQNQQNMKRHIIPILILALGFFTLESCKKCKNEDPSARIINNGNIKCSVQIQTSGGNTVNVNNVMPGTSSDYASYAPGIVTFTVSVGSDNYVETVCK